MKSKYKKPDINPNDIEGCRASLLFSLRALGTGVGLLELSDEEFSAAMDDEALFFMYIQIFKMLLADEKSDKFQNKMRKLVINKIVKGLAVRSHPDTEKLILSPIEYDALPEMPGFTGGAINSIRPPGTVVS